MEAAVASKGWEYEELLEKDEQRFRHLQASLQDEHKQLTQEREGTSILRRRLAAAQLDKESLQADIDRTRQTGQADAEQSQQRFQQLQQAQAQLAARSLQVQEVQAQLQHSLVAAQEAAEASRARHTQQQQQQQVAFDIAGYRSQALSARVHSDRLQSQLQKARDTAAQQRQQHQAALEKQVQKTANLTAQLNLALVRPSSPFHDMKYGA